MTQYLKVDEGSRRVLQGAGFPDPPDLVGALDEPPAAEEGIIWAYWQGRLNFSGGPTPKHFMVFLEGAIEPSWLDPRTLDEAKDEGRARVNTAWIEADSSSFAFGGATIRALPDDIVRINSTSGYVALMDALPPDWPGAWKTVGNGEVPITDVATWKAFYTAFVVQGQNNFKRAQELKSQIEAVLPGPTANADVDAIEWTA